MLQVEVPRRRHGRFTGAEPNGTRRRGRGGHRLGEGAGGGRQEAEGRGVVHRGLGGHRRRRGSPGGIRASAAKLRGEGGRRGDAHHAQGAAERVPEGPGERLRQVGVGRRLQGSEGDRGSSRCRGGWAVINCIVCGEIKTFF